MGSDSAVHSDFLQGLVAHVDPSAVLVAQRSPSGEIVDLRYVAVNDPACGFLGHSRDELLTRSLLELFPQHRGSAVFAAFADVLDTGAPLVWDDVEIASAVRPTGTRFDLRGTRVADEFLVLSWRDSTERSSLLADLQASEAHLRALTERTSDATVCATADGTITWASSSIERTFGWRPDQLVGHRVIELIHPDDVQRVEEMRSAVGNGTADHVLARLRTGRGELRWVSSVVHLVKDETGAVVGMTAGWRDVHDEQLALLELQQLNERFDEMINLSSDAVATGDNAGRITWVSASIRHLTGWEPAQLVGQPLVEFIHPEDRDLVRTVQTRVTTGSSMTVEARFRSDDGAHRWISFQMRPQVRDEVVIGRIIGWRDVHAEHEIRDQLIRAEQRFHAAMQSAPVGMAVVDLEQRLVMVNPALTRLVGQPEDSLLARRIGDILDPRDRALESQMHTRLLETEQPTVTADLRLLHRDGSTVWVRLAVAAMRDDCGRPWGFVSQFLDITDALKVLGDLHHQATHDSLTQLGNREELHERIERMLSQPTAEGRRNGVLFIDIDHLKTINDTYGHHVGDRVLVDVARAIRACTRADDVLARYGGDEFVVVISGASTTDELVLIAEKIRDSVARNVAEAPDGVSTTVSIGVALSDPLDDPATTMRHADEALYLAKKAGRNRIEAFEAVVPA